MKWIVGILIILDSIYQLFGISTNVEWSIYYNLSHYLFFFSIAIYYGDKLTRWLSIYFLYPIIAILLQIGQTREEYLISVRGDDYWWFTLFAIIILISFIFKKKWKK